MTCARPLPFKSSALISDIDGTLVTAEKVLTSRAGTAVKALQAAGIDFAINSGRPPRGMAMLIDPLAHGADIVVADLRELFLEEQGARP